MIFGNQTHGRDMEVHCRSQTKCFASTLSYEENTCTCNSGDKEIQNGLKNTQRTKENARGEFNRVT